ncbi:hypothetical protein CcCBS67573_g06018 [Chytriomyces confervae]|uniref:BEN domain-containing protein n=1 Tax=Chytriomyces confervae TaxID=246404 RepID=A0A507F6S1_9FUNG|nr:hypothetical protein CcCBS67573_g06018 [Chytriomyces confervae]
MQTPTATPSSALDPIKLTTASATDPVSASFVDKYRTALDQQTMLAAKLTAAETTANQLMLDLRRVKAEADALRALVVSSGVPEALARLPPITPLSAFAETHADLPDPSSPVLDAPSACTAQDTVGLVPSRKDGEYSEPSSRRGRSRSSPMVAVSTAYDAAKPIPSPQSMTQSPVVPKREISSSTDSDTHSADPHRRTSTSSTTTSVSTRANTTTTTASSKRPSNAVSTSHMHDHTDNPLPANSLAWTDIIRMRYPNFQRSTVQTSKHAREFIETRQIPFFRVTPTHSLGRSKPTYAIPPEMQKPFLDYFEEKFSGTGVLGRRRPGGDVFAGMPGYDDSFPDVESGSVAGDDKQSVNGSGEGVEGESKTVSSGAVKRKAPAKRSAAPKNEARKNSVSPEAERVTPAEEGGAAEAVTKKAKTTSSSKAVSKSGYILTRYNTIVNRMMPDFKTLSNEARVAIKKGVKQFLQHQLGATFDDCIMMTPTESASQSSTAPKQTYGVPEHLIPGFQQWVYVELKKCFPDLAEKDTLRVVSNSVTAPTDDGYIHDTKTTLKAAAKALGAKQTTATKSVKSTLGPSRAGHVVASLAPAKVASVEAVELLLRKHRSGRSSAGSDGMEVDAKAAVGKTVKKRTYVTEGMPDYVDLMMSNNPKKLVANHLKK